MTEVELIGGPAAGRRLTVQPGVNEIVVPIPRPFEPFRRVVPFRRGPELSFDRAYYYRAGKVYRYEGLIGDAWCDMAVSGEAMTQGGPSVRASIRYMVRRQLEELAPDKEIDGIVWRVAHDPLTSMYSVRARVGGKRVELGLHDRENRRAFGGWLPR